jgi:hypothetical protein
MLGRVAITAELRLKCAFTRRRIWRSFTSIKPYQAIINELPSQPGLHQISLSYGLGETYMPAAEMETDDHYFATLAGADISVFVSSGDGGSSPGLNGFEDKWVPGCTSFDSSVFAPGLLRLTRVQGRRALELEY